MPTPQQAFIESLLRSEVNPTLRPVAGQPRIPPPKLQPVGVFNSPNLRTPAFTQVVTDPVNLAKGLAAGSVGTPSDIANLTRTPLLSSLAGSMGLGGAFQDTGPVPGGSDQIADLLGADPESPATLAGLFGAPDPKDLLRLAGSSNLAAALFHGTPTSRFDAVPRGTKTDNIRDIFDERFIGDPTKGEGATAFGHGIYFAENPGVARSYASPNRIDRFRGTDIGTELMFLQNRMDAAPIRSPQFRQAQERYQVLEDIALNKNKDDLLSKYDDAEFLPETRDFVRSISDDELSTAHLFDVEIPDEVTGRMLDWDAPLSEQPESVRQILNDALTETLGPDGSSRLRFTRNSAGDDVKQSVYDLLGNDATGEQIYDYLSAHHGEGLPIIMNSNAANMRQGPAAASDALNEMGIPGIRFLDQQSRGAGEGTRNIVLFSPDDITQVKRDGELVFEGTRAMRTLSDPIDIPDGAELRITDQSSRFGEPVFELDRIVIPENLRGSGEGTEIMEEIVRRADEQGATIVLSPDSSLGGFTGTKFGGSKAGDQRLIDFYRRHGFVVNRGRNKDFRFGGPTQGLTMYRYPQ
jgi:GNAT superfamily N-acetyltransferase